MKLRKLFTVVLCLIVSAVCFACGDTSANPDPENPPQDKKTYVITPSADSITLIKGVEERETATLTVTVKDSDGKTVGSPEVSFVSAHSSIAKVDNSGVVTAVSQGYTKIKATYKNATVTVPVSVIDSITADKVNTFDEKYINTFGRNFITDGKLNLHHVASGIEVTFYGSELTADLNMTGDSYGRIFIDGDTTGKVVKLESKENFVLAEDLEEDIHTVRFLKCNELDEGQVQISNLSAEKFFSPAKSYDHKIEFIGDSITCGYGVLGGSGKTLENSDACLGYAYLTAKTLDWDYSLVALSGIGVNQPVWTHVAMCDLYKQVSDLNKDEYDFPDAQDVDVVVLNLGTNDAGYISLNQENFSSYGMNFDKEYSSFLTYIRSKRPNAYIVCTYGMMGSNSTIHKGIDKAVKSMNDEKISYFSKVVANNAGAVGHPNETAQKTNADLLTKYINGLFEA